MEAPETEPQGKLERLAGDHRFIAEVMGGAGRTSLLRRFGAEYGCAETTVQRAMALVRERRAQRSNLQPERPDLQTVESDKRRGETDWRELCGAVHSFQQVISKTKSSQDRGIIRFPDAKAPIAVTVIGDWHWGSYGTDHSLLVQLTDEILSIPDLFVIVVGDMEHMAVKLRGVLEVTDNVLPPEVQHRFTESWLEEIGHRILCWTWCNHAVMREEAQVGRSMLKELASRATMYGNGIFHLDAVVGEQTYKLAVSHFFRGRSKFNPVHGQQCYVREQAPDRDIVIAGDSHVPAVAKFIEGGRPRLAVNCGSAQVNSGYAKRFFSLRTHPVFPVFTLHPERHEFTPYWSVAEWLAAQGRPGAVSS